MELNNRDSGPDFAVTAAALIDACILMDEANDAVVLGDDGGDDDDADVDAVLVSAFDSRSFADKLSSSFVASSVLLWTPSCVEKSCVASVESCGTEATVLREGLVV